MPDFQQTFKASLVVDLSDLEAKTRIATTRLQAWKRTANEQSQVQLRLRIANFERAIDKARKKLRELKKQGDEDAIIKANIDIRKLQEGKAIASKSLRELKKDADGTKKSFFSLNGIVRDSIKAFSGFFIIRQTARALRDAFDAAVSFESAFAGVRKTVDATEEEFDQISASIRQLAKEIPLSVEALAGIAESAGQLGVAKESIIDFTETIAAIAVSTNLTEEAAATSFARISEIFQEPAENVSNLASAVVDLGNNFATTETEIVGFATKIAGTGKVVGLTTSDTVALGAAFTSVGVEANAGGTAVQKSLLAINQAVNDGGEALDKFSKVSGVSAKEFAELWKSAPIKAFDLFIKGIGKAGAEGANILEELIAGDVRLQRAFLSLAGAGDLLTEAIDTSSSAFSANTALQEEAQKRYDTTESKLKVQSNRWNDLKIRMGDFLKNVALPTFEFFLDLADALGGATNKFVPLANGIKAAGVALSAAFSLKLLTGVATGLKSVVVALTSFKAIVAGTATPVGKLGKSITSLRLLLSGWTGVLIGATAAVAAVTFAILESRSAALKYDQAVSDLNLSLEELGDISVNTASKTKEFKTSLDEIIAASKRLNEIEEKIAATRGRLGDQGQAQEGLSFEENIGDLRDQTIELLGAFGLTKDQIDATTESLDFFRSVQEPTEEDMVKLAEAAEKGAPALAKLERSFTSLVDEYQKGGKTLSESVDLAVAEMEDGWDDAGHDVEQFTKDAKGFLVKAAAETEGIGAAYNVGFRTGFTKEEIETLSEIESLSNESLGILLAAAVKAEDRGAIFGLLFASGISEQDAEAASSAQNLSTAVRNVLVANEGQILAAGFRSGVSAVQGVINGIAQKFPILQRSANAIAKVLGAIGGAGGIKILGVNVGSVFSNLKSQANDIRSAFDEASASIESAANVPAPGGPGGGGGGGGGGASALKEAEKEAKAAEKAVNDFEKALADSNKEAGELRDDIVDFYQDIINSIDDAIEKQKELEGELAAFNVEKTTEFAQDAGERDAELSQDAIDLEKELDEAKKETTDGTDELNKKLEKIKEIEEEIADVAAERAEIQQFLNDLTGDGVEGSNEILEAFEEAKRRAVLSEFEQNKLALDDTLAAKETEIAAEIAKQQKIIDIQKQFLAIQAATDEEGLANKQKLVDLALSDEVSNAEERAKILKELGFGDLTNEEQLGLLKAVADATALDNELIKIEKQQEDLLATKQEFLDLAEQAHSDSVDRMIEKTSELIGIIERAQEAQLKLNELSGSASAASAAAGNTQDINVIQNNNSNVDVEAALNDLANTIK